MSKSIFDDEDVLNEALCATREAGGKFLKYKPKGTFYVVLDKVNIKTECGDWVEGFSYSPLEEAVKLNIETVYIRSLDMFSEEEWDWKSYGEDSQ